MIGFRDNGDNFVTGIIKGLTWRSSDNPVLLIFEETRHGWTSLSGNFVGISSYEYSENEFDQWHNPSDKGRKDRNNVSHTDNSESTELRERNSILAEFLLFRDDFYPNEIRSNNEL